jgi:hypothetical protein
VLHQYVRRTFMSNPFETFADRYLAATGRMLASRAWAC